MKDFIHASPDHKFDDFMNLVVQNGNEEALSQALRELNGNKYDVIRYLTEMHKKVQSDPQLLLKVEAKLKRLKESYKLKGLPMPSFKKCAVSLTGFVALRDYLHSFRSSFIEEENIPDFNELAVAANMNGLGITGLLCAADMYTNTKNFPLYIKELKQTLNGKEQAKILLSLTEELRSNTKLQEQLRGATVVKNSVDKKSQILTATYEKILNENQLIDQNVKSETKIQRLWNKFSRSKDGEELIQKAYEKTYSELSPIEKEAFLKNTKAPEINQKSLETHSMVQKRIEKSFLDWIEKNGLGESAKVKNDLLRLRRESVKTLTKNPTAGISQKLCFAATSSTLAAVGYNASLGLDKNEQLDMQGEDDVRENRSKLYKYTTNSVIGTCSLWVITSTISNVKLKEVQKKYLLKEKDWKLIDDAFNSAADTYRQSPSKPRNVPSTSPQSVQELISGAVSDVKRNKTPSSSGHTNSSIQISKSPQDTREEVILRIREKFSKLQVCK